MQVRAGTLDDLDRLVTIAVESQHGDPFVDWLWPHRESKPEIYKSYRRKIINMYIRKLGFILVVAEIPDQEAGQKIVGFSVWRRAGDFALESQWDVWEMMFGSHDAKPGWTEQDKAEYDMMDISIGDVQHMSARNQDIQKTEEELPKLLDIKNQWKLATIVTDKAHARTGVGRALIDWGKTLLDKDKTVDALVAEAHPTVAEFYVKCGFEKVASRVSSPVDEKEMPYEVLCWTRPKE